MVRKRGRELRAKAVRRFDHTPDSQAIARRSRLECPKSCAKGPQHSRTMSREPAKRKILWQT
ncbi:hypothetical protein BDV59DRAFT_188154 [Aspergillus ambiguus]|uniref:uncharacterized protein n=1 Tax=Aspergillus ambiguus TaxID=176160 RepID=UPI003CCE4B80